MELIGFIVALCILAVLALRFGHDSRVPADSKEQALANLGLSSDVRRSPTPLDAHDYASLSQLEVSRRTA